MRNLYYILLAILLGLNVVSCETPDLSEDLRTEEIETVSLNEDDNDSETDVDL